MTMPQDLVHMIQANQHGGRDSQCREGRGGRTSAEYAHDYLSCIILKNCCFIFGRLMPYVAAYTPSACLCTNHSCSYIIPCTRNSRVVCMTQGRKNTYTFHRTHMFWQPARALHPGPTPDLIRTRCLPKHSRGHARLATPTPTRIRTALRTAPRARARHPSSCISQE
eukprot:COSAG06_NODE_6874_length_2733_cov_1.654518_3_plen_167_part_00